MLPPVVAHHGFFALWHPEVLLFVIVLGIAYGEVVGPLRPRFRDSAPVPRSRQTSLYLSLFTLYLALGTPLQILADRYLLTAHMIQFVLLSMVMPPLFLIGLPGWLINPVIRNPRLHSIVKLATRPGVALVLFTVVFSLFQLPLLLEATLRLNGVYILDQYLMMLVSIALWWPIYSPSPLLPPMARPLTLLYLFAMSLPTLLTFALITLADHAFYPTYIAGSHALGISSLTDQQVGGSVMKVATMLILLAVFIQEFFRWVHEEKAKESRISIPTRHMSNPLYRPQHLTVVKDHKSDPRS